MVTWNARSDAFFTPTIFGLIDTTKTGFILEHKPYLSTTVENLLQFFDFGVNFFEVSMTSSLAFWGCLLLGIIFLQP